MTWEAVIAISTACSSAIILITVVIGMRQLRHLRQATQLDGMMRLFAELEDPKLLNAIAYVRGQTPLRVRDPAYLAEVDASPVQGETPEFIVLRWLEKLGTLAKNGLIDPETLYDLNMPDYLYLWISLEPIVERMRSRSSIKPFNNAEYLYCDAERWARKAWGPNAADAVIARYRAKLVPATDDAAGAAPDPSPGG